jgi:hypothetical protein
MTGRDTKEYPLSDADGLLALPVGEQPRCAVLVLSGSSGRIAIDRTRLLARSGAAALSLRWFGGPGQPGGICEIPLESFTPALDRLAAISDHLCVIGTSKGAEAALLLACREARIRMVAGLSPSAVVWANIGPCSQQTPADGRSSWSADGQPLPFVPYDPTWVPTTINGLPCYRGLYEQSLATFAERVPAATIPAEQITADVLLAAGGDDQVWPSDQFALQIKNRRSACQLATYVITARAAGHRILLPGEAINLLGGMAMARGGTRTADASLGQRVWPTLLQLLRLTVAGPDTSNNPRPA